MQLDKFIRLSNEAATTGALFALYCREMARLGFDRIIFSLMTDHPQQGRQRGHGIMANYPEDWLAFYAQQEYEQIDPVRRRMHSAGGAFSWESLRREYALDPRQAECLELAEKAGLHDGIGIPLRGPGGCLAGIGAASSRGGLDLHPDILSHAELLSQQFYACFRKLESRPAGADAPRLSEREKDVLAWYALGKTKRDIGGILCLSEHTVSNHLRNAQSKLGAKNAVAAVSRALALGLIDVLRAA